MTYLSNAPVSPILLSDLREAVGWDRMDAEYGNSAFASYYHIAVYDGDKLIGYIDSVSNGVTDAYIQDLMVHPAYQGQGIGTELMQRMIAALKERRIYMISVIYEERLTGFYRKFGFYQMLSGQLNTY